MRSTSRLPLPSNRQTSTLVACAENKQKFTPAPSQVAPRGNGVPSRTRLRTSSAIGRKYCKRRSTRLRPDPLCSGWRRGVGGGGRGDLLFLHGGVEPIDFDIDAETAVETEIDVGDRGQREE